MSVGGRPPRRLLPVLLAVLAASVLALVAVTWRLPYVAVGPGPCEEVDRLVHVPAEQAFPHRGQFLLTSVAVRDLTPLELVRARLDPDVDVVRLRTLTGTAPTKQARRRLDADLTHSMQLSQDAAVVVAARRLGLPDRLSARIHVDSAGVGGGSGGLALTLGLLDALTGGDLTGGHRVAVTGTIAPNGLVGDVDGVGQKAASARAAGAEYLLVPPGGFEVAKAHAGAVTVVKVSTLDEALAVLAGIGGELGAPRGWD